MGAVFPMSYGDVRQMAVDVAKGGLFGCKTPEQAISLMLLAQAEGLHPMQAVRDFDIIQGRPAMKAQAMLARFQQAGGRVQWHSSNDAEASATFSHPAGGNLTIKWDIKRAERAGLTGKQTWRQFPAQMLRARCISEGVRAVYPGCTAGLYTVEEVRDLGPIDVTPHKGVTAADIVQATVAAEADPLAAVRDAEDMAALKAAFSAAAAEARRRGDDELLAQIIAAKDKRKAELEKRADPVIEGELVTDEAAA